MMAGLFRSDADAVVWHEGYCGRCIYGPNSRIGVEDGYACVIWRTATRGVRPIEFRPHPVDGYQCTSFIDDAEARSWENRPVSGAVSLDMSPVAAYERKSSQP